MYEDQFNLYAYVGNDPINGVDTTGLQAEGNSCDEVSCTITRENATLPEILGMELGSAIWNGGVAVYNCWII